MFGNKAVPRPSGPPPPPPAACGPVIVPAVRFVYCLDRKAWVEVPTHICVPNPTRGFEAGGMRICFEVQEIDETGARTDNVAKFFRKNIDKVVEVDYFNEGAAQCMSEEFAQNFNKRQSRVAPEALACVGGPCRISFLMCQVVKIRNSDLPENMRTVAAAAQFGKDSFFTFRTTDKNEVTFAMEYKLKGTFTKYNNNFGEIYEQSDAKRKMTPEEEAKRSRVFKFSEAFSHLSIEESGGSMLVCDLQGVNDFFTDPQIHTEDGKGLGMGNMGQEGIDKWVAAHTCNEVCRALNLRDLKAPRNSERSSQFRQQLPGLFQPRPDVPATAAQPHDLVAYLQAGDAQHQQQQHQNAAASPHNYVQSSEFSSPTQSKPLSAMNDDERLEYAIQKSIAEQGGYRV